MAIPSDPQRPASQGHPDLPQGYGPPPGGFRLEQGQPGPPPHMSGPASPNFPPQAGTGRYEEYERPSAQDSSLYKEKGFFGTLLDLSFDHMITIRLIRMVYLACLGFAGLTGFVMLLLAWSFSVWNGTLAVATLIAIPIVCFFQIVSSRMVLEFLINQFKITEELRKIRDIDAARSASGQ